MKPFYLLLIFDFQKRKEKNNPSCFKKTDWIYHHPIGSLNLLYDDRLN